MAATVERELGVPVELVPGKGGILEARVDGEVAWTNRESRVKDVPDETMLAAVRKLLG